MVLLKKLKRIGVFLLVLIFSTNCTGCLFDSADMAGGEAINNMMELRKDDMTYTSLPVSIPDAAVNLSNFRQTNASVGLFVQNSELFFVFYGGDNAPKNMGRLGVLRDGGAQYFSGLQKNFSKILVWEGYAYYSWYSKDLSNYVLCRFDLQDGATEEIASRSASLSGSSPYFCVGQDGVLYYVEDHENATGYPILSGKAGALSSIPCTYELGGSFYSGNWVTGGNLTRIDASGTVEDVPLGDGEEWLLPCGDGLLAMNITKGNTLYYIGKDGTVTELFYNDCDYGVLAVNSWGNYVFLSIQRYEKYKENALPSPYENDAESGTYRINMQDFTIEKISDNAYNGLYIFREGEIFACDKNSNVHQLDFDGAHLMDIISS